MNNKIKKITLAAVAILVIASGCSDKNNEDGSAADNANNNNQSVVEQPQDSENNDQANDTGDADNNTGNEGTDGLIGENGNEDASGGSEDQEEPADDNKDAVPGEVTVDLIAEKVQAEIQMGSLMDLDNEQVKDMYGIDPEVLLEDGVFLPAMFNVSSHELAVVKLKSDEHYEVVKEAMEQRAASIQKTFENYLPDQYEASKNFQIVRKGDFVLFSITSDQEKAAEVFESLVQE